MNRVRAICWLVEFGAPRFSVMEFMALLLGAVIYEITEDLMTRIMLAALLVLWYFAMLILTAAAAQSRIGQAYLEHNKQGKNPND
jgi:hypothetical protein